jgi:hypothetical protein
MTLIHQLENYLKEILGLHITPIPWKGEGSLPFFLSASYTFYEIILDGHPSLLVVQGKDTFLNPATPASIKKHLLLVQKKWKGTCVYVAKALISYNRKRLIEQRVPFVIPGNQCYLPFLGLDLREHFLRTEKSDRALLSPATQAIVHFAIARKAAKLFASELANNLNYSLMTISRSFDELQDLEIGEILQEGRRRFLLLPDNRKAFWHHVKEKMQSPVKKIVFLKFGKSSDAQITKYGALSGFSALSNYSMINAPDVPIYAVSERSWRTIRSLKSIEQVPSSDGADVELEIWSYDPKPFIKNGIVDPFSVSLIYTESEDDRIEIALEKMEKKTKW